MGLLNKLFGGKDKGNGAEAPQSSMPASQFQESQVAGGNAPRRELVQVVLRETMRRHGIPSDWVDCRILSAVRRNNVTGLHVQFIVRQGHDDLLSYVYPFQESFMREVQKFDPRAEDWLISIAWQFQGRSTSGTTMPSPSSWAGLAAAGAAAAPAADPKIEEDDVEEDLKALFAIRDAALRDNVDGDEPPDFQPTQPGFVDSNKGR